MITVNFFIVGSTKAGTTSLHNYLNNHPQIEMSSQKEPHYFCYRDKWKYFTGPGDVQICEKMVIDKEEDYKSLFKKNNSIVGESTASYLHNGGTAKKIKEYNESAKILIILRNPVDRAISAYNHLVRDGREKEDIETAFKLERSRLRDNWMPFWGYKKQSFYYENVLEYLNIFGKNNVKILVYEECFNNIDQTLSEITDFLGVRNYDLATNFKENVSGVPKSKFIHGQIRNPNRLIRILYKILPRHTRKLIKNKLNNLNMRKSDEVDSNFKMKLKLSFQDDVKKLETIVPGVSRAWGYYSVDE